MNKRAIPLVAFVSLTFAQLPQAGATIRSDYVYSGERPAGSAVTCGPSSAPATGFRSLCQASPVGAKPIDQAQLLARSGIQRQRRTVHPK